MNSHINLKADPSSKMIYVVSEQGWHCATVGGYGPPTFTEKSHYLSTTFTYKKKKCTYLKSVYHQFILVAFS